MSVRERGGGKSSVELLLELSKRIADQSLLDQNKKFKADPAVTFSEQVDAFLSYLPHFTRVLSNSEKEPA